MTQKEAKALPHGIYNLFWKTGGSSVAAVGMLYDGRRWFAPINWTSKEPDGIASTSWRLVNHVVHM